MTSQLAWGFSAHFYLLPGTGFLSLTPSIIQLGNPTYSGVESQMIRGNTLIHCLKACQIWWKSCWQTKCLWALHRYDFLAVIPSWCVAAWLWGREQERPECGNQLWPQVCQSGGPGGQTLWKCGHRTSHFSVNNLKNQICWKSWKCDKNKWPASADKLWCVSSTAFTLLEIPTHPCLH